MGRNALSAAVPTLPGYSLPGYSRICPLPRTTYL
jgi:hypothetical protein